MRFLTVLFFILISQTALAQMPQTPPGSRAHNGQEVLTNKLNVFTQPQTINSYNNNTGLVVQSFIGFSATSGDPIYGNAIFHLINKNNQGPFIDYWAQNGVRWAFGVTSTGNFQWRAVTNSTDPVDAGNLEFIRSNGDFSFPRHIQYAGTAPTVSACGTGSPSIDGNATDNSGTVTIGTVATSCTITFANAYSTYNHCTISSQTTISGLAYSYTKTAITISASVLGGDLVDYRCDGL